MTADQSWREIGQSLVEPVLDDEIANVDNLENAAGRYFIVIYNSTTTVSAVYATFIALAIAAAIGAILGLIYWAFLSSKSETPYSEPQDGYGKYKRSVDEDLPDELNFVHILDLIAQMESSSADSGDDDDDNCENPFFRVCKLSSDRSKTLSGKSGDDWPLTRLIGSARRLVEERETAGEIRHFLRSLIEAAEAGAAGENCQPQFCQNA